MGTASRRRYENVKSTLPRSPVACLAFQLTPRTLLLAGAEQLETSPIETSLSSFEKSRQRFSHRPPLKQPSFLDSNLTRRADNDFRYVPMAGYLPADVMMLLACLDAVANAADPPSDFLTLNLLFSWIRLWVGR